MCLFKVKSLLTKKKVLINIDKYFSHNLNINGKTMLNFIIIIIIIIIVITIIVIVIISTNLSI